MVTSSLPTPQIRRPVGCGDGSEAAFGLFRHRQKRVQGGGERELSRLDE